MTYTAKFLNVLNSLPDSLVYILLGVSAYVENIFPPIPGDTITAFAAFLVGVGKLNFLWVYLSTTAGSLLGFLTLFWIGTYLGRRFFIQKDFRFLKARDIIRAEQWFIRYGYLLIALNRFLPGIRSAISVAGGISRLKTIWVSTLAFLSCAVWNLIWIWLGLTLGTRWKEVEAGMSRLMTKYEIALFIVLGLLIILGLALKRLRKA
ncbi:MAG: DedA family protein [Desulfobacteraceae bacterium]|jgi:membrane protein DedA with SNARE-associated domain